MSDENAPARAKRRSILEQAVVGDLVIALPADPETGIITIEQVGDGIDGASIRQRWLDIGVIDRKTVVEVWECRPGGYYRRRKSR